MNKFEILSEAISKLNDAVDRDLLIRRIMRTYSIDSSVSFTEKYMALQQLSTEDLLKELSEKLQ